MSDTIRKTRRLRHPSGRFVVRIDPELHGTLREEARSAGLSLNELCARRLSLPQAPAPEPLLRAVGRAREVVGDALVGVVVFGSWAGGEMGEASDVDLLVVVGEEIRLGRGLYRTWDEVPVIWCGHPVEPHFVHLPGASDPLSGFWAEMAVDGVVLFEVDMQVSRRLADFRKEIAAGRVSRRLIHGQTYWVGVA